MLQTKNERKETPWPRWSLGGQLRLYWWRSRCGFDSWRNWCWGDGMDLMCLMGLPGVIIGGTVGFFTEEAVALR